MKLSDNIVLIGAGKRCNRLVKIIYETESNFKVAAIADNNSEVWGTEICGCIISSPQMLRQYKDFHFCITVQNRDAYNQLLEQLIDQYEFCAEREIMYWDLILQVYNSYFLSKYSYHNREGVYIKDKKVIFDCCCKGLVLGGIEAWTMDICCNLIKRESIDAAILCNQGNYKVPEVLREKVDQIDINIEDIWGKKAFDSIVKYLLNNLPFIVVTSHPDIMLLVAGIIKEYMPEQVNIIAVIHGDQQSTYDSYLIFNKWIDHYVCVSQDIKNNLLLRGVKQDKLLTMTCPFACDKDLFRGYTENIDQPLKIGYAGRLDGMEHSQKRMDLVLKLIGELNQRKVAFSFEIAGDGPAREEMENYIKEAGLERYVIFLGTIDRSDIPMFWRRQDIGVNLSDYEGRSISQLEAMANGAVLVVTEVSGVKEDIINDENGYYVPRGDYKAAADRIEYLDKHRYRLPQLGTRAHDDIYPKSSMTKHIDLWMNLLRG